MIELNQEQKEEIVDKIASFFESWPFDNWRKLKEAYLWNNKSEDLRKLLLKALNDNEPKPSFDSFWASIKDVNKLQ